MQFIIEDDGVSRKAIYILSGTDKIDRFSYEMLRENYVDGVLTPVCMEKNGMDGVQYDISGLEPFTVFFESRVSMEQVLSVFSGIIQIVWELESYLLDTSYLITDIKNIYYSKETESVYLLYLPTGEERIISSWQFEEKLFNLFKEIIFSARFAGGMNNHYITELLNALSSIKDFSIAEFKEVVDKVRIDSGGKMNKETVIQQGSHNNTNSYSVFGKKFENVCDNSGTQYSVNSLNSVNSVNSGNSYDSVNSVKQFGTDFVSNEKEDLLRDNSVYREYAMSETFSDMDDNDDIKRGKSFFGYIKDFFGKEEKTKESIPLYMLDEENDEIVENVEKCVTEDETVALLVSDSNVPFMIRNSTGEKISINKKIFKVGKDKRYADYVISDNAAISRAHAQISLKNGRLYITDEDSLNHTYVNGNIVNSQVESEIVNGDVIAFADEEYILYC